MATSGTVPLGSLGQTGRVSMFTFLKLLVVIVLVVAGVVLLFGVVTFLAGALWTVIKLALLVGIIVIVVMWLMKKK